VSNASLQHRLQCVMCWYDLTLYINPCLLCQWSFFEIVTLWDLFPWCERLYAVNKNFKQIWLLDEENLVCNLFLRAILKPIDSSPFISLTVWLLIILYLINKPLRCTECNRKTLVTFTPQRTSHEWIQGPFSCSYRFKQVHNFFNQQDMRCNACQKCINIVIMVSVFLLNTM